ncbi:MAG: glycosyltransferase family 2 protein [Flavobacteriales bacterium]
MTNNKHYNISVVIPLFNEEESLPELHSWIRKVVEENGFTTQIVMIDDGSTDDSWKVIESLKEKDPDLVAVKFRRNYGKSAGLFVGFEKADGDVVITMDADLQDSPEEIPGLYSMIVDENYDLVSGWKQKRYDPLTKTIPTKLFNAATRKMSGVKLNDFNCGLKAYKKAVVKTVEVYGEMHRYIPVMANWAGFKKIGEKVVQHQERKYGVTKFGLERFINGFLDLMSITFISKFGKRPMHFFGTLGTLIFGLGMCFILYIGVDKLFFNPGAIKLADRTEFYIALIFSVIGVQLFITGFIAEMIARNKTDRNKYHLEKVLD